MIGKRLVLALEIERDYVKGIKFQSSLKGLTFKGTGFTPITIKEEENWKKAATESVKKVFSGKRADRTEVISLLPGHLFFLRNYTFPIANQKKVKQAIPFEMEGDIPLPLEDVVIDSVIIKGKEGSKVFAFALPKEILKEHLDLFPEGFKPKIVIPDFVALSFLKTPEHKEDIGILEVGHEKLTFVATCHRRLKATRSISLSNMDAVSEKETEEMASTLKEWRALGVDIGKVYLCGDGMDNIDKERLSQTLEVGIEDIPFPLPLKSKGPTEEKNGQRELSGFTSLIGAGYINLDVNLLRSEEEAERKEIFKKKVVSSGIGLMALILLGLTDLFVTYSFYKNQFDTLKLEVRETFQDVFPEIKNIVNEQVQFKSIIKKDKENLQIIKGGAILDFDPLWVFDLFFVRPLGGNVTITELRIKDEIVFQGEGKDQLAVDSFVDELSKRKEVLDVRIQRVEHAVDSLRFHGSAKIKEGV